MITQTQNDGDRIVVHFSCGAASAVAAKVACDAYAKRRKVVVLNFGLPNDEHSDNQRFLSDVQGWIGQEIVTVRNKKYASVEECWRGEKYIVGAMGASCTRVMKRELGDKFQMPDDVHVLGFTADERGRIADLEAHRTDMKFLWLLADAGITKEDCYHILTAAEIELPAMYRLGFNHNNCIGCCKGGKGYWNKVRKHFPGIFAARAKVQRELGIGFRSGDELFFLDELGEDEGRDVPEPPIECGLLCASYEKLIDLTVKGML